jgi:parallel beta-helix repeat protein
VGNTTPLVALVTDAGGTTRISGGSITTAAPVVVVGGEVTALVASGQFYNDAVTLGANATLTAGVVGLVPTVAVGGDEIAFGDTVDGAYGLVVNTSGSTTFNAAVGGTTPLASLATDSGGTTFVMGLLVKTTGNQSYADRVAFDDSVPAPTSAGLNLLDMDAFDLEVLLPEEDAEAADLDSSASLPPWTRLEGAAVSLLEGLDGGGQQLLIAGNAVFGDQPGSAIDEEALVDAVVGLTSLSVTGSLTVNSTSVETTALQTYQGAVTLGSDVFFGGGGHRFDSTITGPGRTLLMIASSDGITLGGDVGTSAAPLGPIAGLTFVGTILVNAAVYSTGPVTFFSVFGSIDGGPANAIYVPAGDLSLAGLGGVGATNPIAVEAATVSAISTLGDIRLRGIGDLVVGDDGIMTDGTLSLDASGQIRVPGGRMLRGEDGVTATKPIRWGLAGTTDSGAGSLRDVIGQANATGVAGIVEFGNAPATFVLSSQLPDVTTSLVIDGGNQVTIAGNNRVANGITFAPGSTGSQLKNVTLQGFRNFGIRLDRSPGVMVDGVRVTSLNTWESMGLYASGDLAGTSIVSSRFSGGLRGALLVNARNLAFGAIGRGNTFIGNRSVPGSRFAGTGIRAQGDSTGTVVQGNTFTQNHYGFAFLNARNLRLANNSFSRNTIAAIFVEGNNQGSVAVANTFGAGGQENAKTFQRVRGATGV